MPDGGFGCTKCGACCRRIARLDPSWPSDEAGVCLFLREDNTCGIYDERPLVCRVDDLKPDGWTTERWYEANSYACNMMQVEDDLPAKFRLKVLS